MTKLIAQITNPALKESLQKQTGLGFFQKFLPNLVGLAFLVGALVFFFIMIIGAIQWITSGGDKAALEAARGRLANAIIGFVVLAAVFALIKVIESFLGIDIIEINIAPLYIT